MTSVMRTVAGMVLLGCASLALHGCGLETGSDEGPGNATNPTEPPLDPNTTANRLRVQGLLDGTTLTLQRTDQPDSTLTLVQNGDIDLTGTGLDGVQVGKLNLLATNTQANQGSQRIQRCTPETDADDSARLRIHCREFLFLTHSNGHQLWVSDGTVSGTELISVPGNTQLSSQIGSLTVMGNKLYFRATDEAHGAELWVSSGTTAGTHLLADINLDNSDPNITGKGSNPVALVGSTFGSPLLTDPFTIIGDWLFFSARETYGKVGGLWKTNGQVTSKVTDNIGSLQARVMDGDLYYTAYANAMDRYSTIELWKMDGSTGETEKLLDIGSISAADESNVYYAYDLISSGKRLYFSRRNATDHAKELWYLEKNQAPVKVLDIENTIRQQFNESDIYVASNFGNVAFLDGITYFTLTLRRKGSAWFAIISRLTGDRISLEEYNNLTDFRTVKAAQYVKQFWRTDGTVQGTYVITGLNPRADLYYEADVGSSAIVRNGQLYLGAGRHLSVNDTSPLNIYDPATGQFTTPVPNLGTSNSWGVPAGEKFFINGWLLNRTAATDLYVTDGTEEGTRLVQYRGTYPDSLYSLHYNVTDAPTVVAAVNGKALVRASYRSSGTDNARLSYWITDGTPDNTQLLAIPEIGQIDHL